MSTPFSPEMVAICESRLAEITDADTNALTQFAESRLAADGASRSYGEDAVQRAFQVVLRGLETDQGGRRPRLVDINDKPAFLNYMRGVISSVVYKMTRSRGFQVGQECMADNTNSPDLEGRSPAQQAELKDLSAQLFPRLRARAPRHLLPTIDAWERVFLESDRIPPLGRRAHVREVRDLAQQVLTEIGGMG